jgi:hypothetical protein
MAVWLNLICKMLEMDDILAPNIMLTPLGPIQKFIKKDKEQALSPPFPHTLH